MASLTGVSVAPAADQASKVKISIGMPQKCFINLE
jgi:hypothetical protein